MDWFVTLLACLAAYFTSRWLTGAAGAWGQRRGIVSQVTERSSHVKPTSRLGGVGLAGGILLGFAISHLLSVYFVNNGAYRIPLSWLAAGWLLMFIVGLLDDLHDLKPILKLVLLCLAAALPILAGINVFESSVGNWRFAGQCVTFLWILFFVNAYNFMDGMDGFAGNFARCAGLAFFICACLQGVESTRGWHFYLLPLILAASATGFLHWNKPPAKFFMGDGGSLSTGYLLALFVLLGPGSDGGRMAPLLASQIILLPFTFDVVLTLIRRARRGERLMEAHRSHLYQRLMQTGLTHAQVLRINLWLFAACGVLGIIAARLSGTWPALAALDALALMLLYWRYTLRRERQGAVAQKTPT